MKSANFQRTFVAALLMAVSLLIGTSAQAQICGFTTVSGGTVTAIYDPFSPTGTTIANTTLILKRINGGGNDRTSSINFNFFSSVPGLNGLQVNGVSIAPSGGQGSGSLGGGTSQNLFFASNETPPMLVPSGSPTVPIRTAFWDFAGASQNNDNFALTVTVVLPSNLDTTAGTTIPLNLRYSCVHGTGNNPPVEQGTQSGALVIGVNVLSALQASYVGTPTLDFGEVGTVTNAQVTAAAAVTAGTYTRQGNIRVASSGPYIVSMSSANNYRLSFNGTAGATNTAQSLAYAASFVQNTKTGVPGGALTQTPITRTCARAGVGGTLLPLSVRLLEGGLGAPPTIPTKTPAPNYSDTLTITLSPKLSADVGLGSACP